MKKQKENYEQPQIQLELPDYSMEYEEWLKKQNNKKEEKNIIIIDIY